MFRTRLCSLFQVEPMQKFACSGVQEIYQINPDDDVQLKRVASANGLPTNVDHTDVIVRMVEHPETVIPLYDETHLTKAELQLVEHLCPYGNVFLCHDSIRNHDMSDATETGDVINIMRHVPVKVHTTEMDNPLSSFVTQYYEPDMLNPGKVCAPSVASVRADLFPSIKPAQCVMVFNDLDDHLTPSRKFSYLNEFESELAAWLGATYLIRESINEEESRVLCFDHYYAGKRLIAQVNPDKFPSLKNIGDCAFLSNYKVHKIKPGYVVENHMQSYLDPNSMRTSKG